MLAYVQYVELGARISVGNTNRARIEARVAVDALGLKGADHGVEAYARLLLAQRVGRIVCD